MVQEYLGLVDQPPKRRGVNDAVPIALKFRARWRRCLGVATPARPGRVTGVWGQRRLAG